jgi:hypothetical protein
MTEHLPPNWAPRLLAVLGAPRSAENLRLLAAWAVAEGGTAKWNPLNTTYPLAWGSSRYNNSEVKNYSQPTGGVCATALTLATSHQPDNTLTYGGILGDLQGGKKTAEQIVNDNAAEFHTWGTGTSVILSVLAQ